MKKLLFLISLLPALCYSQIIRSESYTGAGIEVTILGTGNPNPEERASSGASIRIKDKTFVFDTGRNIALRLVQSGISLGKIDGVFYTHYHSDHTVGLPDLWLTGWIKPIGNRLQPLNLYGPPGVNDLASGLMKAYGGDISVRVNKESGDLTSGSLIPHEYTEPSLLYSNDEINISSFKNKHGMVVPSFGYRINYKNQSVCISGDTTYSEDLIKACKGVDVLIHEIGNKPSDENILPINFFNYKLIMNQHTDAEQLVEEIKLIQPKTLVLTHYVLLPDKNNQLESFNSILNRIRKGFNGNIIFSSDLTRIEIIEGVGLSVLNLRKESF